MFVSRYSTRPFWAARFGMLVPRIGPNISGNRVRMSIRIAMGRASHPRNSDRNAHGFDPAGVCECLSLSAGRCGLGTFGGRGSLGLTWLGKFQVLVVESILLQK